MVDHVRACVRPGLVGDWCVTVPDVTAELLDAGPRSRHVSARARALRLVIVAVVVSSGAYALVREHEKAQRAQAARVARLDDAHVAFASWGASGFTSNGSPFLGVNLVNAGHHPLHIGIPTLTEPGVRVTDLGLWTARDVAAGQEFALQITLGVDCRTAIPLRPATLRLPVRSAANVNRILPLALDPADPTSGFLFVREYCAAARGTFSH